MSSRLSPATESLAEPPAHTGSLIYRLTIHRGLGALVAVWTAVSVLMSMAVTAVVVGVIWGGVGWPDLAVSAAVSAIVAAPIAYMIGKLMRELNQSRTAMQRLAQLDALTGLANRGYFFQRAEQLLRPGTAPLYPLAALMIDVDHFKAVNDDAGHAAGDGVLAEVACILQRSLRGEDFLARYGGEEFVALLPQTDRATAMVIAERMRVAVAGDAELNRRAQRQVTISIGVAETGEVVPVDPLLLAADRALYAAKADGRNRAAFQDVATSLSATARLRALRSRAGAATTTA